MRTRSTFIILAALLGFAKIYAQVAVASLWQRTPAEHIHLPEGAFREFEPDAYEAYHLDYEQIKKRLAAAPREFSEAGMRQPLQLELPASNGAMETFAITEAPVVTERIRDKYPEIRSYAGYSLSDPVKKVKITLSPYWGFRATIRRADKGLEYIEPLAKGQQDWYMVYDRTAFPAKYRIPGVQTAVDFPATPDHILEAAPNRAVASLGTEPQERGVELAQAVKVKVYRFACAATGEFSQDHGGTTASVLAAMVNYRCINT